MTEPIGKLAARVSAGDDPTRDSLDLTRDERGQVEGQLAQLKSAYDANDLPAMRELAGVPDNVPDSQVKRYVFGRVRALRNQAARNATSEEKNASGLAGMAATNRHDAGKIDDMHDRESSSASQFRQLARNINTTLDAMTPPAAVGVEKKG